VPLPDEGEDVEHGAISIAERPPLAVQDDVVEGALAGPTAKNSFITWLRQVTYCTKSSAAISSEIRSG
jgi:hypothetical protein